MKMTQLNALARVANDKTITKTNAFFRNIFMIENKLYATNDAATVEVRCLNEIKCIDENYFDWKVLDLEACAELQRINRYVDLNNPNCLLYDQVMNDKVSSWNYDYMSRFFEHRLSEPAHFYEAKQVSLVVSVFKAFGMPMIIEPDYNVGAIVYHGEDKNYKIRALIYPRRWN